MRSKLVTAVLVGAMLAPGCKTFGRVVDVIDWTGGAISASADILRAAGDDLSDVWGATGGEVPGLLGLIGTSDEAPSPPPAE